MSAHQNRVAVIVADLRLLKWMAGLNLAFTMATLFVAMKH
jgi:hypothetical protein